MKIREVIKYLWGPKKTKDRKFQITFPTEIVTPKQKVMHTLSLHEQLTAYEISSYANLGSKDVEEALNNLKKISLVKESPPDPEIIQLIPETKNKIFFRYKLSY